MNSAEKLWSVPRVRPGVPAVLGRLVISPRFCVYLGCMLLAVWVSYLLGKDMNWDTLDYHFYAGFSALHDRFGSDYFPAGSQTYFNPYVYVPFYLLASSGLPAVVDATILAAAQSGILWLTYEIAIAVSGSGNPRARIAIAIAAVLLAFGNPILINQFGSSYADVTTAELVLAGWLLLVLAVRAPSAKHVILAGLLLGIASALKLTNSLHALCAGLLLFFIPVRWPVRIRYMVAFGAALAISFALVCMPWALRLEQHFGNPFFPLFNEIFRSPQFPTARTLDYRFIPDSLAGALRRPFEIATPVSLVDDELAAPDLRYAVLLSTAILLLVQWGWRRRKGKGPEGAAADPPSVVSNRALAGLGCAFLADWILWLTASANGRYFVAIACIAGVLVVAMVHRLCISPRVRAYAFAALLGAQFAQLYLGTQYRNHIPWDGGPWFEVRMPGTLPDRPTLYLSYGVQSNAFIAPFLPRGAGFVNIAGDYPLPAEGANGAAVASLVRRYSPNIRLVAREVETEDNRISTARGITPAADALRVFGLRPETSDCATIVIPNEGPRDAVFAHGQTPISSRSAGRIHDRKVPESNTGYLITCQVVPQPVLHVDRSASQRAAETVLDRLEDACPDLFQPARPMTQYFGDMRHHDEIWARRYLNTNLTAWVSRGWVQFVDPVRGGPATYVGPVAAFESKGLRIGCGRRDERYFAKVLTASTRRSGS